MIIFASQEDGLFGDMGSEGYSFKITDSGLVIKPSLNGKNITLSAGLKEMDNYCYAYIIGAEWFDSGNSNEGLHRILKTTAPSIFHWSCNKETNSFPSDFSKIIKKPIDDVKAKLSNGKYNTIRIVELPTL